MAVFQAKSPPLARTVGPSRKSSRGDKTPLELFVAGVQNWDAGLRRILARDPNDG